MDGVLLYPPVINNGTEDSCSDILKVYSFPHAHIEMNAFNEYLVKYGISGHVVGSRFWNTLRI